MVKPKIAPVWQQPFLDALARTGNVRIAAAEAGVDYTSAYARRQRDAGFAEAWAGVLREHAAGEESEYPLTPLACGESPAAGSDRPGDGPLPGAPAKGRGVLGEELVVRCSTSGASQIVRAGAGRWSAVRETRFFVALAECANVRRAASAAGVSSQAIYARRLKDRNFRAQWDAAIEAGKARLETYLIEAADRTFDPEMLPVGDGLPRVSVAEALAILRLKGGSGAAAKGGHDEREADDGQQEYQEACQRVVARLERMGARDRKDRLEAGWSEVDGEMVPPGFRPIAEADGPAAGS